MIPKISIGRPEMIIGATLKSTNPVDWVGLHEDALKLCYALEEMPASVRMTDLSLQASALADRIKAASFPTEK